MFVYENLQQELRHERKMFHKETKLLIILGFILFALFTAGAVNTNNNEKEIKKDQFAAERA